MESIGSFLEDMFSGTLLLSKCHYHPMKMGLVVHIFGITLAGNIF